MTYVKYIVGAFLVLALVIVGVMYLPFLKRVTPANEEMAQIKDAYFLTRIAQDRLQYANDIPTAKQLLQLAQDRLIDNNSSKLKEAKAILAADQEKLNATPYPDLQSVNTKLATLDELIAKIDYPAAEAVDNNTPANVAEDNNSTSNYVDKILLKLKKAVKIRKRSTAELASLSSDIDKARLKLLLEQMRWAVVYGEARVYSHSIECSKQILNSSFKSKDENVNTFIKILNELETVQLQADKPDIDDAVKALQSVLVG